MARMTSSHPSRRSTTSRPSSAAHAKRTKQQLFAEKRRVGRASARFLAPLLLLAAVTPLRASWRAASGPPEASTREAPRDRSLAPLSFFDYPPLDPNTVHLQPEGLTVETSWVLDLYTLFHSRDYKAFRLLLTDEVGAERVAHLLIPPG